MIIHQLCHGCGHTSHDTSFVRLAGFVFRRTEQIERIRLSPLGLQHRLYDIRRIIRFPKCGSFTLRPVLGHIFQ